MNSSKLCSEENLHFYEVVSRFFGDQFYNIIYHEANKRRNTSADNRSMTDFYCEAILSYLDAFKNNNVVDVSEPRKYYKLVMTNLVKYYNTLRQMNLNFTDFTHEFMKNMFPEKLLSNITTPQKQDILFNIMRDIIRNFTNKLKNNLRLIIDDRKKENYNKVKSLFTETMIEEKQAIFNDYISVVTNNGPKSDLVTTLRKELHNSYKKYADLQTKYNDLLKIAKHYRTKLDEQELRATLDSALEDVDRHSLTPESDDEDQLPPSIRYSNADSQLKARSVQASFDARSSKPIARSAVPKPSNKPAASESNRYANHKPTIAVSKPTPQSPPAIRQPISKPVPEGKRSVTFRSPEPVRKPTPKPAPKRKDETPIIRASEVESDSDDSEPELDITDSDEEEEEVKPAPVSRSKGKARSEQMGNVNASLMRSAIMENLARSSIDFVKKESSSDKKVTNRSADDLRSMSDLY